MNAVIYARVSTEEQGDNFSLPSQVAACERYAVQAGLTVLETVQDVMSGAKLDRPGLSRVRELARNHQIDAVIVYASDRFTRSVAHSLLLRDELRSVGAALHTVSKGQASQDTPEGGLFETIEAAFSEFERLKIRERMMRGKRQKIASGKMIGHSQAPYGYQWEGDKASRSLTINDEEAQVIHQIAG